MRIISTTAFFYDSCSADHQRDVPAEGYRGWTTASVEFPLERTALVSMHAWALPCPTRCAGYYRAEEYLSRAKRILEDVFPPLLAAVREAGMPVLHVVGWGDYYKRLPGYLRAVELAGQSPPAPPGAPGDPAIEAIREINRKRFFPGERNLPDIEETGRVNDFAPQARPLQTEGIAENAHQLNTLCRELGVSHLIYIGFAVNWCLLMNAGGIVDMSRLGYLCSTIREATTAAESRESARAELHKQQEMWRIALGFGLVLELDSFLAGLRAANSPAEVGE